MLSTTNFNVYTLKQQRDFKYIWNCSVHTSQCTVCTVPFQRVRLGTLCTVPGLQEYTVIDLYIIKNSAGRIQIFVFNYLLIYLFNIKMNSKLTADKVQWYKNRFCCTYLIKITNKSKILKFCIATKNYWDLKNPNI